MTVIKNQKSNTYEVRTYYKDWTGVRKQKTKRGFKRKCDAQEWERAFKLKENLSLDMYFEDFVDLYLNDIKSRIKYNTWLTKKHIVEKKILPYFSKKKLQEIKPSDIRQWQNTMMNYRNKQGEGYSQEVEMEDNYREVKKAEPCLKLIHMDQVEVEEIEWLFYPFIPYGKVTIIQGDPGEGKTTVVLQIIAKLTKGEAILSETSEGKSEEAGVEPINVIYQTAEDGLGDTIKPRLLAAGADCSRVLVIDDQDQPLTMVDARLEEAIIQTKARLVVLDPIQGFLGAGVDMHRANEIRPLMKRISVLAEKYQCAIILIGHMNKNSNGKSSYRGLGSIDFQAAARSVLIVGRVKDEPEIRVICHVKSSLAPEGDAIAFRLDKEKGFHWIGKYDISADDLLSGDGRGQKIRSAKDFLKEILANGSMEQAKIAEEAEERGIKKKTLWNAKKELQIDSVKIGNKWFWMLQEE